MNITKKAMSRINISEMQQKIEKIELERIQRLERLRIEEEARIERLRLEEEARIERLRIEEEERIERLRLEEEARIELQRIEKIEYEAKISNFQKELRICVKYNSDFLTVLMNLNKALSEEDQDVIDDSGNSFKKHRNIVITAETQNGKTGTMLDIIEQAPVGTLTVVSCDNRGDQMEQISGRMSTVCSY